MIPTRDRIIDRNKFFQAYSGDRISDEFAVELRKKKRRDKIAEKRMKNMINSQTITPPPQEININLTANTLEDYSSALSNPHTTPEQTLSILQVIQAYIGQKSVDYESLILSDVTQKVMELINHNIKHIAQVATLIVCNLAYGPNPIVQYMIERGVTESLVQNIGSDLNTSENAIWAMGNLAAENEETCEVVLNSGFLNALVRFLESHAEFSFEIAKVSLWASTNVITKTASVTPGTANSFIKLLKLLINCKGNPEAFIDWVKLLSILLRKYKEASDLAIESHFALLLVNTLQINQDPKTLHFILDSLGVITYSGNKNTQILISYNLLGVLNTQLEFISTNKRLIYWVLSNIAGGNATQVSQLVSHPVCIKAVAGLSNSDFEVQKEASYMFFNISVNGCAVDMVKLVRKGLLLDIVSVILGTKGDVQYNLLRTLSHLIIAVIEEKHWEIVAGMYNIGVVNVLEVFIESGDEKLKKTARIAYNKIKDYVG